MRTVWEHYMACTDDAWCVDEQHKHPVQDEIIILGLSLVTGSPSSMGTTATRQHVPGASHCGGTCRSSNSVLYAPPCGLNMTEVFVMVVCMKDAYLRARP